MQSKHKTFFSMCFFEFVDVNADAICSKVTFPVNYHSMSLSVFLEHFNTVEYGSFSTRMIVLEKKTTDFSLRTKYLIWSSHEFPHCSSLKFTHFDPLPDLLYQKSLYILEWRASFIDILDVRFSIYKFQWLI